MTPSDSDLVKDGAAAIRTLGSSVDSTLKTQVDNTVASSVQKSLLTTTGDTIYASGTSTPARLGIGSTGQVLTVSGGVPTWATSSSGGMTLISETVASAATGITFGSIPSTYKQLLIEWSGTQHSATGSQFGLRINNDSGSNYNDNYVSFEAASVQNSGGSGTSIGANAARWPFGQNNNSGATASFHCKGFFVLDNYASSTKLKTYNTQFFYRNVADSNYIGYFSSGYYNSTTAVTSLDIVRLTGTATLSNITNSTIRLYGLS